MLFQGNVALCTQIVIQSFLSRAVNGTVENGLKTSFIIPRLQTEIVFDNLRRKQAVFWLLASWGKGGNTCSLSARAREKVLTTFSPPVPAKGPKCFPGTKSPHCLKHLSHLLCFVFPRTAALK